MTRIAVVDDHRLLLETVVQALRGNGYDAVGCPPGSSLAELAERLSALRPDLVLLDLDLSAAGESIPLVAPLVSAGIRVLVVTGLTDRLRIAEALENGAIGYQPKALGFDALVAAATAAATADGPLRPDERTALLHELTTDRRRRQQRDEPFRRLTERERETLRALGEGHSVRQIAASWVVSEATVRSHVRSILTKLGARSQLEAVVDATRNGWLVHR